jgi:tRNA (Thr-GGU) A37 N-methylase
VNRKLTHICAPIFLDRRLSSSFPFLHSSHVFCCHLTLLCFACCLILKFHANTNTDNKGAASKKKAGKIMPPALNGKKVGVFATRTPHRPNPIGFSLCKIESIEYHGRKLDATTNTDGKNKAPKASKKERKKNKDSASSPLCIHISGLDLIDGTPVLDVKPYVGIYDSIADYTVPEWVSTGLELRRAVEFNDSSEIQLRAAVESGSLQFYGTSESELAAVRSVIVEVLGVDVRSAWQNGKVRSGTSRPFKSEILSVLPENAVTQQLDNLLVHYVVGGYDESNPGAESGTDDDVIIIDIQVVKEMKMYNEDL